MTTAIPENEKQPFRKSISFHTKDMIRSTTPQISKKNNKNNKEIVDLSKSNRSYKITKSKFDKDKIKE